MKSLIYYGQIYSDSELESIHQLIQDGVWKINPKSDNAYRDLLDDKLITKDKIPYIPRIVDTYYNFIHQVQSNYLKYFTDNKFTYNIKIARYKEGHEYKYHVDELSSKYGERVLSSITYLNDDFDGGETEILDEIIVPQKNFTVIFPSNWVFLHKGLPILSGVKYIMVVHCYSNMSRSLYINS